MTEKKKITWIVWVLGVGLLLMGATMIHQGIFAYKTGAMTPPTTKSAPMTGLQSILAGVIATLTGVFFVRNETLKAFKDIEHPYDIGKQGVVVKQKNKSWGITRSLDLYSQNGAVLKFYCTDEKVGGMLLNDFKDGQKAELNIKTNDGKGCDLIAENCYAHGMISLERK